MKKFGAELKRHALTAISYMLPLVVASGPSWVPASWAVWSEATLSVISHCSSESI